MAFFLLWWKWILLGGIVSALVVYVANAEHNRDQAKARKVEVAACQQTVKAQAEYIDKLNERIKKSNDRLLEQVKREKERLESAQAEVERIKAERDRVSAALAVSRREWQEAVAHDPDLAEFVAHPVPAAVWDRLRRATGN